MIRNWQNTGQQKALFASNDKQYKEANDPDLVKLLDAQIAHEASFPFQCGMQEVHMHYMECVSNKATLLRRELVKKLQKSLEASNVHDAIIRLLVWGITWTNTKDIPTCALLEGAIKEEIQKAISDQTAIGWHNMRRGFINTRWSSAQSIYNSQLHISTPKNWSKIFVSKILNVSWTMWNARNEALHGTNSKER